MGSTSRFAFVAGAVLALLLGVVVGTKENTVAHRFLLRAEASAALSPSEISPEFWPDEEFEHYLSLNEGEGEEAFEANVVGPRAAMTVEIGNALAGHVGTRVLEANGTAADAAIAAAVANIVLNNGAIVSLAGFISALYYDSERSETKALHGHYWTVPENNPAGLLDPDYPIGALTPIPAFFADAQALLDTYGSGLFTLGDLLAPSIWLADEGIFNPSLPGKANDERVRQVLGRTSYGQQLLAALDSEPEFIPQPEVAALLRNVSQDGIEFFYKGEWAQEAVETLREWGSNITVGHLAEYYDVNRPVWQTPQTDELLSERTMYSIGAENMCAQPGNNIASVTETYNIMRELGLMGDGKPDFTNDGETLSYYLQTTRYVTYIEGLAGFLGALNPLMIGAAFLGPLAPVEEGVILLDPISASNHRSSREHASTVAQAMMTPEGMERMNSVIDAFTFPANTGSHSDGILVHDKYGNAISMLHTINALPFGTGLFVHGVALPDSLLHNSFFLQGPWYDRSKSVQLPDGLMMNLVTGSDGLPQTLVTAINSMHLSITPLVLLTSGWGRGDVGNMIHGGPFAWPAPDPSSFLGPGYNPLQFLLFTKDSDDSCTEYCPLGAPFPAAVTANLEPWILPYTQVVNATNISTEEIVALGILSYYWRVAPAVMRIQNRTGTEATSISGAVTYGFNGIAEGMADPVSPSEEDDPSNSTTENSSDGLDDTNDSSVSKLLLSWWCHFASLFVALALPLLQ